jgi:hypothetical protein
MPRQIIDTESSRPRYVRRVALTTAVVVVLVAAVLYLAYAVYAAGHANAGRGGNTPSPRVSWQPSIKPAAVLPGTPKESPCFVA